MTFEEKAEILLLFVRDIANSSCSLEGDSCVACQAVGVLREINEWKWADKTFDKLVADSDADPRN